LGEIFANLLHVWIVCELRRSWKGDIIVRVVQLVLAVLLFGAILHDVF